MGVRKPPPTRSFSLVKTTRLIHLGAVQGPRCHRADVGCLKVGTLYSQLHTTGAGDTSVTRALRSPLRSELPAHAEALRSLAPSSSRELFQPAIRECNKAQAGTRRRCKPKAQRERPCGCSLAGMPTLPVATKVSATLGPQAMASALRFWC